MNSKGVLIGLVLVALVAGVFVATRSGGPASGGGGLLGVASYQGEGAVLPAGGGEVPSDSVLSGVRGDAIAVLHMSPRNVDPAVNYVENFWKRLASTNLGKMQGLKPSLIESAKSRAETGQDPEEVAKAEKAVKILSDGWNELTEAVLVVLEQSVEAPDGTKIPYTLVQGKFAGTATPERLREYVDNELLKGQASLEDSDGTVVKRSGAEGVYDFEFGSTADSRMKGALFAQGETVALTFGASEIDAFKSADEDKMLVSGSDWKAIGVSLLPATGLFMYLDYPKLETMINGFIESAMNADPTSTMSAEDLRRQINSQFKDLGVLGASVDFAGGFNSLSCMKTEAGSKIGDFYRRLIESRTNSPSSGLFHKLVGENSLLAFRFQLDTVPFYFDFFRDYYGDALDQAQAGDDAKRFRAMIDTAEREFNRLGYKELGVVASVAPGNPMPEVGLFLGNGSLDGEEALTAVAETMNQFLPQPMASVDTSGPEPRLQINSGQPVPVQGAMVGHNSVFVTSNPYAFDKVAKALDNDASYLASTSGGLENPEKALEAGDYFLYINTELLLQMARPWLGMAASQTPGSGPKDIEEVAELFAGRFISTQVTTGAAENVVCSRAQMLTLQ